jgi:hypothetical protein
MDRAKLPLQAWMPKLAAAAAAMSAAHIRPSGR